MLLECCITYFSVFQEVIDGGVGFFWGGIICCGIRISFLALWYKFYRERMITLLWWVPVEWSNGPFFFPLVYLSERCCWNTIGETNLVHAISSWGTKNAFKKCPVAHFTWHRNSPEQGCLTTSVFLCKFSCSIFLPPSPDRRACACAHYYWRKVHWCYVTFQWQWLFILLEGLRFCLIAKAFAAHRKKK